MFDNDYSRFAAKELGLNDYLALERTILANERTALSFFQNGLAFIAGGLTSLYTTEQSVFIVLGWVGISFGGIAIMFGTWRFMTVKRRLDSASPARTADRAAEEMSGAKELQK